ncbi:MAG: hypothetical protein ABEJ23_00535 [Haloarculaceae archaeon]
MADILGTILAVAALLLFFVVGWYLLYESQGLFRDVLAMVLTRTMPVGEVREGRVEVTGTARPVEPDRTLTEPIEAGEALAYEYRVTQEEAFKDDIIDWTRWGYREQAEGDQTVPFYVEDATGRLRVDPGAPDDGHKAADGTVNLYATRERSVHVDDETEAPASLSALHQRADVESTDRARVYTTAAVEPGDEVYVLGTARFDGDERVVEGADRRFVVAGASQLRTLVYNAGWGLVKFVVGVVLVVGCGGLLLMMAGVV